MEQTTFRRYGFLIQFGFMVIFFLINFIENYDYYNLQETFFYSLNYTLLVAGVALINYFYILPFFIKGHRWFYFALLILVMTLSIVVYYCLEAILWYEKDENLELDFWGVAYDYLLLSMTTAYTSLFYFVEHWFKSITVENRLRNEKLLAELNFLKSQINPHFLFNTLNNIYAYAQTGNEKTAAMLERLSSILRFMVYDCGQSKVALSKEVEAVEDLLEILRMKNDDQRNITLNVAGVKRYHLIAPLIIVNFVENACKHSNVVNRSDGYVKVSIHVSEMDTCHFEIANTYTSESLDRAPAGVAEQSDDIPTKPWVAKSTVKSSTHPEQAAYSGLGLDNIKKRLDLQYADRYQLSEKRKNGTYNLSLIIPLERKQ